MQALLSHARDKFDYPIVVRAFSEGVSDENERVRTASLEGLATLHERLGALLQGLLTTVGASDAVKRHVADRIKSQLPTPYLNVDGLVEQQVGAPGRHPRMGPETGSNCALAAVMWGSKS